MVSLQDVYKRQAQVVQEAHEGLKAAQERLVAAEKRLSDFKNAPELLVKAQSVLSAAVANLENKKEKLEEEFTTLQSYQSVVELLNSQYEDLASRIDPAILEAADMPMDIRSSNMNLPHPCRFHVPSSTPVSPNLKRRGLSW